MKAHTLTAVGLLVLAPWALPSTSSSGAEASAFERIVTSAEKALEGGNLERAYADILRALERDPKSRRVWGLRTRWAEAADDEDELVYSLHGELRLAAAQQAPRSEVEALRKRVLGADPLAADLLDMRTHFIERLVPIAEKYEAESRPHAAIRVHRQILSMDPEREASSVAIERLASAPDPSLAEDAKAQDLLEGISEEWIREHDGKHDAWKDHAKVKRDNYTTKTSAGYAVLIRASESMEQMNSFYRQFFRYGTKEAGGSVPRIDLNIFKDREEYLKVSGAVEWSGGNFTGNAVNTYITSGGFEDTVGTLFHEAAHQFVSLATNASGWLNEGLASFFEGCRILPNGTVEMNLPANNRLIPLVARLKNGWMRDSKDGIDQAKPADSRPSKAPTLAIVIENEYEWGPPWYAPTWGLVYFFYNFQDPVDGRYLYRDSFWEFVNKSGGRVGSGAVKNFEEIVLGNPADPTKGVSTEYTTKNLPKTTAEMDPIFRDWLIALYDVQLGKLEVDKPYLEWARHAIARKALAEATDHLEKGLRDDPESVELLSEFAELLAEEFDNEDRASKLALRAIQVLEAAETVDEKAVAELEKKLKRWDPERDSMEKVRDELWSTSKSLVQRYLSGGKLLMTMDLSERLGNELGVPGMFELYAQAARQTDRRTNLWRLAYNEEDLRGWAGSGARNFEAQGEALLSRFTDGGEFDYRFLTVDTVTSGDFSLEAELQAGKGDVTFCGLVFGKKTDTTFHAAMLFPGKKDAGQTAGSGFIDLTSFYGGSDFKTWRHVPARDRTAPEGTGGVPWINLRIDVTGAVVDVWHDGNFVASQDFGNADVLRGSFGLLTGPGSAVWRNVRYLSRPARDPAAALTREMRLENVTDEGGSIGGSWLGKKPPFPTVSRWVQGERSSWDEFEAVPQLLVLFSQNQNDLIPINAWLDVVQQRTADVDMQIVCIASPLDEETLEDYLTFNGFPGVVGADRFPDQGGIGITFEQHGAAAGLPRLVLLDVDGRVYWEGDPGFKVGMGWDPSVGSFLDTPLDELISKRRLREYRPWVLSWNSGGKRALSEGNLEVALPLLLGAAEFDGRMFPEVRDAQAKLGALRDACANPDVMARTLEREEAEPAMDALVDFSQHFDTPIDARKDRTVKSLKLTDGSKDWKKALDALKPLAKRAKSKKGIEDLTEVADVASKLETLQGRFPRQLAEQLRSAADGEQAARVVLEAESLPANWLMKDYFNW